MSLSPGQSLGHYRLVDKIGEGGMGVIWKALDTELDRNVALKFLPDSFADDDERLARFRREAKTLAALNHPNIVTIFSVEQADDVRFLTMELVEGQTLSELIPEGGLPIDELLRLAVPLADALSAAHEQGVTHRDLKPANVMVTRDGRVKILDFGLAKFRQAPSSLHETESETGITREGDLVGTIRYMSPEQLDGRPADERSDIFSLGVILYEMATGRRPFQGAGPASLMSSILNEEPPPLSEVRDDLPVDLARIVRHCMQKDADKRYQTAKGLRSELDELAVDLASGNVPRPSDAAPSRPTRWIAVAAIVVAVIAGWWTLRGLLTAPVGGPPEVLVLPFEVRGQQQGAEMLGLSVAEAVAVDLAPAENLHVLPVARERSGDDPIEAGKRSGSRYVVTGAVRRAGSEVSLSIQLVDAEAGRLLDGVEATGPDAELAATAARLTLEIAQVLGARFARTYGMVTREVSDPELRVSEELGEFRSAYRAMDVTRILAAGERLVAAFPDNPETHAVRVYARVLQLSDEPTPEVARELENSLRSLERLDPRMPYLDFGRATLLRAGGRPHEGIRTYDRLLERADLSPAFRAWMLRNRSQSHARIGDDQRALNDAQAAMDLDPANPWAFTTLSTVLIRLGRAEEALEMARRAVGLRPTLSYPHMQVGATLMELGRADEAVEALTRSVQGAGTWQAPFAYRALALRQAGRADEADAEASRAAAMPDTPEGAFALARERALAGRRSEALEFLRRARDVGFADPMIATVPQLRELHGHPAFEAVRREVDELVRRRGAGSHD